MREILPESGPMTPVEYAKIRAVLARIQGLRIGIIGTLLAGASISPFVFGLSLYESAFSASVNPMGSALYLAAAAALPFVLLAGFLSTRVNRHINCLSRWKYQRPKLLD